MTDSKRLQLPGVDGAEPGSWLADPGLALRCAKLRAAARLDIRDLASMAFNPPKGKMSRTAWTAFMSRSMLQILNGGMRLGTANPDTWHTDWALDMALEDGSILVEEGSSLQFGNNALNWQARRDLSNLLAEVAGEPISLSLEEDRDIAGCVLRDMRWVALGMKNGSATYFVPVPPWLTDGTTMQLPAGCGAALLASELSLVPGPSSSGLRTIGDCRVSR